MGEGSDLEEIAGLPETLNSEEETEEIKVDISENKPTEEDKYEYINGFVTGIKKENNTRFVAFALTYPGMDAIIWCSKSRSVNIGDWVEAKVKNTDFAKYFPKNPTPKTPRADIKFWKPIETPKNYSVAKSGEGLQVNIKNFQVPSKHKSGNPIEDQFLGLVDDSKNISNGSISVNLLVSRRPVFKTSNGNHSCWSVKKSEQSVQRSESLQDGSLPETSNVEKDKKPKKKRKPKQSKKSKSTEAEKCSSGDVLPCETALPSSAGLQTDVVDEKAETVEQVQNEKNSEKVKQPILKRAVVMSIKSKDKRSKKGEDQIAFLWLLDDHQTAVLLTSGTVTQEKQSLKNKLYPGYFLEGLFQQDERGRWMCTKHIKKLDKLMEFTVYKDRLELQFVTDTIEHVSTDRFKPETYHCFIGKIIDNDNKLPTDCSSGVKINIKFSYVSSRAARLWIVSKVHRSSKHVQLLTEFHQAWHVPGIRDLIRQKCLKEFVKLQSLMDTLADGLSTEVQKPINKKERAKKIWKFAWVVEHSVDSVGMVVFPRLEEQEIGGMKKTVKNRMVYQKVQKMDLYKLYKVNLDPNGDVIEMIDCPQCIHSDESGNIEFKFVSCNDVILARNVAIVKPIGVPEWLGNLMFAYSRPIGRSKKLMKTTFRLLDDQDLFANENAAREHGVFFVNTGDSVENLPDQDLEEFLRGESKFIEDEMYERNLFKTKLQNLHPNQEVFPMFQTVCFILKNRQVVEEMKNRGINTDDLMQLQSSIRI